VLSLIPLPYRVLGIMGILAILAISFSIWKHSIYKSGYKACVAAQVEAARARLDTANLKISKEEKKHEARKRSVHAVQGDNPPVGPRTDNALRGMPDGPGGGE
jgi:hypothetical protein